MAYILLLLVHMANLEPNVLLGQRSRRRVDDVLEALEAVSTCAHVFRPTVQLYLKTLLEL